MAKKKDSEVGGVVSDAPEGSTVAIMSLPLDLSPKKLNYVLELDEYACQWNYEKRITAIWARSKMAHEGWTPHPDGDFIVELGTINSFRIMDLGAGTERARRRLVGDAMFDKEAWAKVSAVKDWELNVYGFKVVGVVS